MRTVGFPGLGLQFTIDRIAFNFAGRPIYWYGIIIGVAVLTAAILCVLEARRLGFETTDILDCICFQIVAALIGARLYYVIFNWKTFDSFSEIFEIWKGGIAIYGAIIGGLAATYFVCKFKKRSFPKFIDIAAFGLPIGQAIGRWGNFVNIEAYGSITNLPWRMEIPTLYAQQISVHPTFLYESLWCLVGFVVILLYRKHKRFDGELFLIYAGWYGLGRAWIEGLRMDSLPYGASWRISQLVAILSFLGCVGYLIFMYVKKLPKKVDTSQENNV